MAKASEKLSFSEVSDLLGLIILRQLRETRGGRGETFAIIRNDWGELAAAALWANLENIEAICGIPPLRDGEKGKFGLMAQPSPFCPSPPILPRDCRRGQSE